MHFIIFHSYLPSHCAPYLSLHLPDGTLPSSPLGFSCNIYVRMFMCVCSTHERNHVKFVSFSLSPVVSARPSAAVIKTPGWSQLIEERVYLRPDVPRGTPITGHAHHSGQMWKQAGKAASAAESSHLRPQTASREGTENRVSLGKPQSQSSVTFPSLRPHLLALPQTVTNCRPSKYSKPWDLWGTFHSNNHTLSHSLLPFNTLLPLHSAL